MTERAGPALRVGLVGVGYWGVNLLRNLIAVRGARVAIVCDVDRDRLERVARTYPSLATTTRFADLVEGDGTDAIVVATDPDSHHRLARAALEAGRHVLVEKPLARTSADCRDLIEVARAAGRRLMVGHTFAYNQAVLEVRRHLEAGTLGEVYYVASQRLNLGIVRTDVDVVWNLAPHDLTILDTWFGCLPESVGARGLTFVQKDLGLADVAYLHLDYPGGRSAHVHLSWLDPSKVRRMTVVGSERMLVYDDVSPSEKIRIYDKSVTRLEGYDDYGQFQLIHRAGDVLIPKIDFEEPLRVECQHFVDSIAGERSPRTDGQAGLRVVRILEAASRSMAEGGRQIEIGPT